MQIQRYRIHIILTALLGFILAPSLAQGDISVSLSLDRREATAGDSIRMSISISGSRDSDANPIIQGMEAFHVTTGGTSSRIQIINGSMSAAVDYAYFLQPKKEGTFQIGPARITIDGKTYTSNTDTLQVNKDPEASRQGRGPLFLMAQLSSPKAYTEEQVVYSIKLYRQARVSDLSLDLPKAENLVLKKLGEPSEYQSVLDGKTYQVLELRYAILPARKGIYGIPPAKMGMTVYQPRDRSRRDPFFDDRFFSFSRGKPMTVSSPPLELEVIPLPAEGRPTHFSGLVGRFHMSSQLEPSRIQVGDSATLTIDLKGSGNVTRMPDLAIPEMNGTKVYEDQPVVKSGANENGVVGSKTMKWALVPERAGQYNIPVLSVSFFDPQASQYKVLQTTPFVLSVTPSDKKETITVQGTDGQNGVPHPTKKEVTALGHDILPIHTSVRELATGSGLRPTGPVYWAMILAPPLLFCLVFCGRKMQRKAETDRSLIKAKKAAKAFMKTCRKEGCQSNDLADAIRIYLNDRLGLSLGALTPKEAHDIVTSHGVTSKTAQRLADFLQQLENAIYTGEGGNACHMGHDVIALIKRIDKEVR